MVVLDITEVKDVAYLRDADLRKAGEEVEIPGTEPQAPGEDVVYVEGMDADAQDFAAYLPVSLVRRMAVLIPA